MEIVKEETSPEAKSPAYSEGVTWTQWKSYFNDPVTLPWCHNSICRRCIARNKIDQEKNQEYNTVVNLSKFPCPFCKKVISADTIKHLRTDQDLVMRVHRIESYDSQQLQGIGDC